MRYAKEASCTVVFVHYHTSDRHPYPIPFQDCCTALDYVWTHHAQLNIDPHRIAVGGDSAGGCLAALCAQWARDHAHIPICFQLLIYPVTDLRMSSPSMHAFKDSPFWNAKLNERMWKIYLRDCPDGAPPYAAPCGGTCVSPLCAESSRKSAAAPSACTTAFRSGTVCVFSGFTQRSRTR